MLFRSTKLEKGEPGEGLALEKETAGWSDQRIERLMSENAYTMDDNKTKAWASWISPKDFLQATTTIADKERIAKESTALDKVKLSKETQPILLEVRQGEDGKWYVSGHEGRHRMYALANAGVDKVPVVLYTGSGKYLEPMDYLFLRGQRFAKESGKSFLADNLTPISYAHIGELKKNFGEATNPSIKFASNKAGAFDPNRDTVILHPEIGRAHV